MLPTPVTCHSIGTPLAGTQILAKYRGDTPTAQPPCMYIQHIQGLCQSRLSSVDHALSLGAPATTAVSHLNGRMLDRRQV
jgi:hypothetical protein